MEQQANQNTPSPKEEYEQQKKDKLKQKQKNTGANRHTHITLLATVVGVVLVIVLLFFVLNKQDSNPDTQDSARDDDQIEVVSQDIPDGRELGVTQRFPIQGQIHINPGEEKDPSVYNSNPPTSGWHYAQAPNWGYYPEGLEDEAGIHGLEHGGIWISYRDLSEEEIEGLRDIQRANRGSTLLSPRPTNDERIAVAAWGKLMHLDTVNRDAIEQFINKNRNKSPEPFAQ